jgi:hypothetical protein
MLERNKLRTGNAPESVKIYQLTEDQTIPSCHVYMEAQVFTPDSKRLVLHRAGHPHGPCKDDPSHAYILCDLENNGELSPLTLPEEHSSTSTAVSPDGKWFYYFIDRTEIGSGQLILKRVRLDGTERETLFVLDDTIFGTRFRASRPYPLATISADGAKIALQVFLGDGYTRNCPHGLLVFDLNKGTCSMPLWGSTLCNMHAQYSRSNAPDRVYDLLIQENHGYISNAVGEMINIEKDGFVDLHVISDDGCNVRDLPMGGSARELCSGHQCWRGDSDWVISSVISIYGRGLIEEQDFRLLEARPVPHQGHLGAKSWWGERNEITGREEDPRFNHFGFDSTGKFILTEDRNFVSFGRLNDPGCGPSQEWLRLVDTGMRQGFRNKVDSHPFLSPDGKRGFFNSNESGQLQAYMIDGLDSL